MIATKARRVLGKTCLIGAAVALAAGIAPWTANAQTSSASSSDSGHPKVYSTQTDAIGVEYFPDQEGGLTPIKDTFFSQFVAGSSSMSSSNGPAARSALVDPGNGVTKGPATACGQLGGLSDAVPDFAPLVQACTNTSWPFLAEADGFNTDPSTAGAITFGKPDGALYGQGGEAHAHVGDDGTAATDAVMGGLRIAPVSGGGPTGLPLPPSITLPGLSPAAPDAPPADTSIFTSGAVKAVTSNAFDGSATIVSHAEASVTGVRLLGGLVTIDSISSVAESKYTNGADPVGQSSTTVQGVKVLGQPATIDDQGIKLGDGSGSGGTGPVNDAATQALKDSGLVVKLVGATQGVDDKGFMTAASQGVVVEYTRTINTGGQGSGTYFARYYLASVSTRSFDRDLSRPSSTTGASVSPPISPISPSSGKPSGFTGGKVVAPLPAPSAAAPAAAAGGDAQQASNGSSGGLGTVRLKWLYLSFTLAALGVCLVPRLVLPARLPGRASA